MLLSASGAFATSYTWQGASGGSWGTTTNWNPNGTPGSADDIVVDKSGGANINLNGARSVRNITLGNTGTNAMTIQNSSAGGLSIYGAISSVAGSTGAHVISCPIVLATNLTVTMSNTTGSLDIQGAVSGGYSITKVGTGKLTVSGATTNTGPIYSDLGTLTLSGSHTWSTGANDNLDVNTVGAQNAMLKVTGGTSGFYYYRIARGTNAVGSVYHSNGSLTVNGTADGIQEFSIGYGGGSSGYYKLSGGSITTGEANVGGYWGGDGIMDITGGTLTDNGFLIVGRGSTSSGVMNITGGTVAVSGSISLNWATNAGDFSVINLGGGAGAAAFTGQGTASVGTTMLDGKGISLTGTTTANTGGGLNLLNNGTLTVSEVTAYSATPISILNFNGGTLKATSTNTGASFLTSANIGKVYVHSGGAIIDDNGTNITISRPLLTVSGTGVTSVNVTAAGAGYFGAPLVTISGGTGTPATAYANMIDDGTGNGTYKVSSVTVTTPGVYTVAPTTVTFSGGGPTSAATATLSTGANATTGGLTKNGSGTVTLSGTNTYSGSTTLNSGTLALTNNAAVGTGTLILSGGTLVNTAAVTLANTIEAETGTTSTLDIGSANNFTFNGGLTGSGTITRGSSYDQTLYLAGDNSGFTGTYQDQNDALSITRWSSASAGSASARWIFNQAQLTYRTTLDFGTGTIQFGSMTGSGILSANSAGTKTVQVGALGLNETFAGSLREWSGVLALTKVGSGTWTLSGTNTYTGATSVSAGTLKLNNTAALGSTTGSTSVTSGAVLDLNGVNYASAEALTLNGTGISSNGALINSSSTGATYAGLLTLGSASSILGGTGTINVSNTGTVVGGGFGLTLGGAQGGTLASILSSTTASLSKQDAGTWTLSGANTYTGATSIGAGTLKLGVANALPSGSAVTATGTLDLNGRNATIGSLAGGGFVDNTSASAGTYTLTTGGDNTSTTFSGVVKNTAQTVALTKSGTGTFTISGTNTFSGATSVAAGILKLGNTAALGATTNGTSVTSGAALDLNGVSYASAEALTLNGTGVGSGGALMNSGAAATYGGLITLGNTSSILGGSGAINVSNTGTITGSGFGLTLGGAQGGTLASIVGTGAGTLTKQDAGTWTLSGANTYTGATTVSAGVLKLNNTAALGTTAAGISVTSGAALDLNGVNYASAEALTLNGTGVGSGGALMNSGAAATYGGLITLGSASSILGGTGTINISNTGTIAGSGFGLTLGGAQGGTLASVLSATTASLTKQDAGSWTMTGTNTFSGATTVNAGTLLVNGSNASSTTTVNSGAILGGTGSVGAIVANSGTVRPGSSGSKGILGGTTANFSGGTNSRLSIRAAAFATVGTDYDRLNLSGALTLNGTSLLDLDMTGIASAGTASGIVVSSSTTGTFDSVAVSNYTGVLGYNVVYNGTSIDLVVKNQAPSFTKGANQTVAEDAAAQSVAGWATSINKGSTYESGQTVSFTATNDNNTLFSVQPAISSTGTLTYTPAAGANGSATVTVRIHDDGGTANSGVDSSAAQTFTITVTAVNDAPSYTSGSNVTVLEDASAYSAAWATSLGKGATNESSQILSFTLTNNNNGLFSAQPAIAADGALSFTPTANAVGAATVTVRFKDDGGTAGGGVDSVAARTFTITVTAVNDAPSYTSGSNITVLEDASAYSAAWASAISTGPANESSQSVAFTVTNNANALFSVQPAIASDGTLTFTPAASAVGTATVTVRFKDDGGTANSAVDSVAARTFTITMTSVNDAPSYTSGSNITVLEDAFAYSAAWATALAKGPSDESSQSLAFTLTNNANTLFSAQPAIASDGTLSFTPAGNATGVATVTVRFKDNGGTANGAVDSVAARTFTITLTAVNDAPSFTKGADQTLNENAAAQTVVTWASAISSGPTDESAQTVSFAVTNTNSTLFSVQPAIASNGTLTYTLAADENGSATVSVRMHDNGGVANSGVDSSAVQTFTITVGAVNQAPSYTSGANVTVLEDASAYSAAWATSLSKGPTNENGQALTFTVTNSDNALFSAQPTIASDGTLSFTPAANANGTATVTVRFKDDGGTASGGVDSVAARTFTITLTAVNDVPSYTSGSNVTVLEDASAYSAAWATALSRGPANENGQTLSFTVTNSDNALFSAQPAIAADGTLSFTPAENANGTATVTVRFKDNGGTANGAIDSVAARTFTITMTSVNDAPSYTSGSNITVLEDASAHSAAWATGLSKGPSDESSQTLAFTLTNNANALFSVQPAIASDGTLSFTPAANAVGTATVSVRFNDNGGTANGAVDSLAARTFTITLTAVNDAPSFTKGADQTVNQNAGAQTAVGWASAISSGPTDESAQTVSFAVTNTNNTLFSAQPAIASNGTLTYTLAADENGSATVSVRMHDNGGTANGGLDSSAVQTFTISVGAVNQAPSYTSGSDITVLEDASAYSAVWASSLSKGPTNENGQTLSFTVTNSDNALFSAQPAIASDGTLSFTPAANANGTATVTVRFKDDGGTASGGVDSVAARTFTITLTAVNDAPSYTSGSNVTVLEDASAYSAAWATALSKGPANENGQALTFTVTNSDNALFDVQPAIAADGTLSFTPAANAIGTATVTVRFKDDGATANGAIDSVAARTFTITLTAVNDAPSYTSGSNITVLEDASAYSAAWATGLSNGPSDESSQTLAFTLTNNANTLFSVQPAIASDGTLSFTPAGNATGVATVTVRFKDNGGTANGAVDSVAARTFTITLTAVNDAPSFTKGADQTVNQNAGAQTAVGWASAISSGPTDESAQTVSFAVTNTNNTLFSAQPAIASNGTLTYTLAADENGSATVSVRMHDNGGTANGGVDSSAVQTFTISVGAVNQAPSYTSGSNITVLEDASAYSAAWATSLSKGPTNENGQALTFTVTNSDNALFSAQPAIASDGTLNFTPAANANGTATVTVRFKDDGGTASGGVDSVAARTFTITLTAVNDAPSYTSGSNITALEDASAYSVAWATALSKGPANENGQALTFTVTNSDNALFDVQPAIAADGTLSFTPAANAIGTATVTVRFKDDGATANGAIDSVAARTFTITLTGVNDAPSYTSGSNITVLEDASAYSAAWATALSNGPSDESSQTLAFTLTNNANTMFSVQPAIASDGTLSFTPAGNASGVATVTVRFKDNGDTANGAVDSVAARTFTITLTAVNDAPSFTKGADQTVNQNAGAQTAVGWASAISSGPTDESAQTVSFAVTNTNNTLFSVQPAIASNGTLTYTLAADENGSATVSVRLHDDGGTANGGVDSSAVQTFTISVGAVNQAPSYTSGANVTVLEDASAYSASWASSLSKGPTNENGQTLSFTVTNSDNALFSVQPAIASDGTLSFTPAANANGTATVTVRFKDDGGTASGGVDSVAARTFTITLTAVNDVPSYTSGSNVTVLEDASTYNAAWATALSKGPANENGQALTFTVTNSDNALFSAQPAIAADGTLSFTAAVNAIGTATVTVRFKDDGATANGSIDSVAARTFTITMTSVNDAPTFTSAGDIQVLQNSGAYSAAWASAMSPGPTDESGQSLAFSVTNDNNGLFSVQPSLAADGTLSFTPGLNTNGLATVRVLLEDDGGTTDGGVDTLVRTFAIAIGSVNQAPSYISGPDLTVLEDGAAYSSTWAASIMPGPVSDVAQTVAFSLTNNNNGLFSAQPSMLPDGTLEFTTAADANGTATVTVRFKDNGGTVDGGIDSLAARTFLIHVTAVDDAPSFSKGSDESVLEDAGAQSVAGWATAISKGPANESGQTLTFVATNDNNTLFATQPSVAADGTLSYTPAAHANGTATISLRLRDNGGATNGGVDSSALQTFQIQVAAVNDAPTFVDGAAVSVLQNSGAYSAVWPTSVSAGGTGEGSQTLSFTVTNDNNTLFSVQPALAANGTLTFTPESNANGSATVSVRLHDDGGTALSGVDSSVLHTFTITVGAVNQAPSYTSGSDVTVLEDAGAYSAAWASDLSKGPVNENAQVLAFTVTNGDNTLFSAQPAIAANGVLTFTPAANANGATTVTVRLHDGGGTASGGVDSVAARTFTITLTAVNDAPAYTSGANVTVLEDASAYSAGWASSVVVGPADEAGQQMTYTLTNDANALFSVQPAIAANGTLTFTPAASAHGSVTVTVRAKDDGGTTNSAIDSVAARTFTITVSSVNQAPSYTSGSNITVLEDASAYSATWATDLAKGPGDESSQNLTFTLTNDNNGLFGTQPAIAPDGTLTFTPAADANGTATVTVRFKDDGGTTDGGVDSVASRTFTITLTSVNDAPSYSSGSNITVLEDASSYSAAWATGLSKGPSDESSQTLAFTLTNTDNTLFSVQPAIASDGTLSFTPAGNANGVATVTVRFKDNGATANGAVDSVAARTFTITLTAVNDAPSFTKGADQTVNQNAGAQTAVGWASAISSGPTDESTQTVSFAVTNTNNTLFSAQPAVASNGTLTYTLAADENGSATVSVRMHDNGGFANSGVDSSAVQTFTISVGAVNQAPSYTSGANVTVLEDASAYSAAWATSLSKGPTNENGQALTFTVTNSDNALFSAQPSIAADGTLSFTPAANANGTATVTVRFKDDGATANGGVDSVAARTFTITLTSVNDAPSFADGVAVSVLQNSGAYSAGWATALSAGPASESSQTLSFTATNDNAALFSAQPAFASNGTLTFTPATNINGSATVSVRMHDNGGTSNGGIDSSSMHSFSITVGAVNQAPSFTKGTNQTVNENAGAQSVAGWASAILAGPVNESGQSLTFAATNDNNALFSVQPAIAANGTLTYTPETHASGSATVSVRLRDNGGTVSGGVDSSAVQTFTITVNLVNEAPSFTKGADQSIQEDAGPRTVVGWASALDKGALNESSQNLSFSVTNDNAGLFSAAPTIAANGTLAYTAAANANGSATVTVRLHDDGGTAYGGVDSSAQQTFTITVASVNDAPSFTDGVTVSVLQNAGAYSAAWATAISAGPTDESSQTLSFTTSNDNNALFSAQPALATNGTLTFTPALNASGTTTVSVRLRDNGATANGGVDSSSLHTFAISVGAVNQAPGFTKGSDQNVGEDAGAQTVSGWASAISAGPANESGQSLTFSATNDNNTLFGVQPAIASNGTLTYTPAANASGAATVTVRLRDDGGTADGGVDSSGSQTFTITVTSVNDAPSFTKGADQTVVENAGSQSAGFWANVIRAGPANESSQTLSFSATNDNNALFSAQPEISVDGTLSHTPAPGANGTATVTVRLHDNGGTAGGGIDSSVAQTFTITVTSLNDAPSYTSGSDVVVLEDDGHSAAWATGVSVGPTNESSQVPTFTTTNDNNGLFATQPSIASNGTLTFVPTANAHGTAVATVRLRDNGGSANGGVDSVASRTFSITVTSVNDAPSFADGAAVSVLQNSGAYSAAWATSLSAGPSDESSQTLSFAATNDNNALFSVQPAIAANGTLTFTPASNASGTATVSVRLRDNGATSNGGVDSSSLHTFTIAVGAVNQAPSFTKGSNQTVLEDAAVQSVAGWATALSAGPAGESGQTLSFVSANDNAALFSAAPAIASNGTLTYTLAANAHGTATVTVRLRDNGGTANGGVDSSAAQTFAITATGVNDAPSFADGATVSVSGNSGAYSAAWATSLSAGPSDEAGQALSFTATNDNNALFSVQPSLAANGTLTFTPASNASGMATVSVRMYDNGATANGGVDSSSLHTFTIAVGAVNQAPSFTKGADQTVLEDAAAQTLAGWATSLSAGAAGESGQTLSFALTNDNAALFSAAPSIASNGTLTYTLAANANGTATVTVRLRDNGGTANGGVDSSAAQTFAISVTSVNDAPSFADGAAVSVSGNSGAYSAAWATSLSAGPSDEAGQALSFTATNDNNALFSVQPSLAANGTLTFTPASNASGMATVSVRMYDNGATANGGVDSSSLHTFTIAVGAVNQAPSFTKGADQTVLEDATAQAVVGWATSLSAGAAGESGQTLSIALTNDNAALFSAAPAIASNGTLTYTLAANANGTATVTVRLRDNGGTANGGVDSSAAQAFAIFVTSVNDAPSFTDGAAVSVLQNSGAYSAAWATSLSTGPSDEAGQTLSFAVTNDNNALFSVQPAIAANGTLTFTPASNASGTATVSVRLRDNGATANGGVDSSSLHTFAIAVGAVNQAPSFTKGADQTVLEDAAAQTVAGWATSLSAGAAGESGQTLSFALTNDNASLFSVAPAIASNGTLTYTLAANATGSATVTVRLRDNGGTANGGVDSSAAQTFAISVTAVNDAPSFADGAAVSVLQNSGAYSAAWATVPSAGPSDESGQTLSFVATNDNNALFSVQPAMAANGTLTFTPASNASGMATVSVRMYDNGSTANGGVDSGSLHSFAISVGAVNQAPSFTKGADQTVLEDATAQTVVGWATALSAGPAGESGQELNFAVTNDNAALFATAPAIASNGTLTYTLAANANGRAIVTARLRDNGGTANGGVDSSAAQTFSITATGVNDAPSFAKGLDLTTLEDGGAQRIVSWATSISAGQPGESGQKMTFVVANSNSGLFRVQPRLSPDGTLEYEAAPDAHGTATVRLGIKDDGGTADGGVDSGATQTFTITVLSVNDAPSFAKGRDTSVDENSGTHRIKGWAGSLSVGPPGEASQKIGFRVSTDNDALFATSPSIDSAGNLTFASKTNTYGQATISVRMGDDGGALNGGSDSSAIQTFKISIREVLLNLHPPVIVSDGGKADVTDSVKENTVAVTTIRATDADSLPVLRYSIHGGVDAAKFRIDSLTGALSFLAAPDHEAPSSSLGSNRYLVSVRVSDGLHQASQNISVEVVDVFEPTDPPVRLDLAPDTLRLLIGDTARPTLLVRARTGGVLVVDSSKLSWSWTPTLGSLKSGLLRTDRLGTSILKATLGTLSDSVVVVVAGVDSLVPPRKDTVAVKVGAGIKASVPPRDKPVVVDVKPQDAPLLNGMVVSTLAAQLVSQTDSVPMGLQIPVTSSLAPQGRTSQQIEVFRIDSAGAMKRVAPVKVVGDSAKFSTQGPGKYVLAWDTTAPKVAMRMSKDSLSSGSAVSIGFSTTDNSPDATSRICWRAAGVAAGICRDIHSGNTDSGVANVKRSEIPLGAEIWMEARDQTYSTSSFHKDVVVHLDTLRRAEALPDDRYDLLSMPYFDSSKFAEVELERVFGAYDIRRWRAYRTTPEGFVEVKNTDTKDGPGSAWWVRTRKAISSPWYSDAWTTPTSKPVEVRLAPGWTAVGSPYSFDVDWKSVMDSSKLTASQVSGPYAFAPETQSWSLPDTTRRLKSWHGVLVRNNTDSTLVLKFPSLSWQALGSRTMAFAPRNQRFDIVAAQAGHDSARINAGLDSTASIGLDALDHPLPPTPGRRFTMAFPAKLADGRAMDFLTDVRPSSDSATRWTFHVGGLEPGVPLVLRANASAGSSATPVWLIDQKSQAVVDWTNSVEFAVGDETERAFTLVVGGKRPVAPTMTRFGIQCGRYDVRWQVPSSMGRTQVRVELLDLRGRRVRTIVDEEQDPGEYSTYLTNHGLSKMPLIAILSAGGRRASVTYLPLLAK